MKVGHAGTLDPFATGLLACSSAERRGSRRISSGSTSSTAPTVQFGVRSDTGDPEGTLEAGDGPLPTPRS